MSSASDLAAVALEVATRAAELVMVGYRRTFDVMEKGKADLVTEYDHRSEDLIRELLAERTPGIPVVGEERGGSSGSGPTWYIDPIDGTVNFVHGHPYFSISVGALDGTRPIAGAVVAPALGLTWQAWIGTEDGRALRNGERCKVSRTAHLGDALVTTGFPAERSAARRENIATFCRVIDEVRDIRRCASAAIDICLVGDGTYDACWERQLKPWDSAAAACVALAAGGTITDLDGSAYDLIRGRFLVSNGLVHQGLLSLLHSSRS